MRFLLLAWVPDDDGMGSERDEDWMSFDAALRDAGVYVAGGAPQPHPAGTWVTTEHSGHPVTRVDESAVYAEAELGSVYLIECADAQSAEEWARRMPSLGDVEVRPIAGAPAP